MIINIIWTGRSIDMIDNYGRKVLNHSELQFAEDIEAMLEFVYLVQN